MTDQHSIKDEFSKPSGNGHGNGSLIRHRLNEVERRLAAVEKEVQSVKDLLIRIDERLNGVATKEYVWKWLVGTIGLSFLTIILHILFRWMTLPSNPAG